MIVHRSYLANGALLLKTTTPNFYPRKTTLIMTTRECLPTSGALNILDGYENDDHTCSTSAPGSNSSLRRSKASTQNEIARPAYAASAPPALPVFPVLLSTPLLAE